MKQGVGRGYAVLGLAIVAWAAALVYTAIAIAPDLYWYSYFSVDYTTGFIRRGLAGELLGLFPADDYFTGLKMLRWLPTLCLLVGLAVLARAVAWGSGWSERRGLLALIAWLMPCGFAFALFSARPDLFGASAVIGFAVAVRSARSDRSILVISGVFGAAMAVLALVHEAIPFLFGLGVIATLAALAPGRSEGMLRWSVLIAMGPGLAMAIAVSFLGRHGNSDQLCQLIPHGPVNWPAAGKLGVGEILSGTRYNVDYHDWICRNITPLFDQTIGIAVRSVIELGLAVIAASTALGIAFMALTLLAIRRISGVTLERFRAALGHRVWWLLLGFGLALPIFLTAIDWTRWWLIVTFEIAVVYLLFASREARSKQAIERDLGTIAILVALMLAAPLSAIPVLGGKVPV